jgi:predicted metal-dependent HD superfamily phosphohydrolase
MTLVQKAEQFVFDLFKDNLSLSHTYHNFNHTQRVVRAAQKLMAAESLTAEQQQALSIAAWFHDTGYVNGTQQHEQNSVIILRDFAKTEPVPQEIVALAESLILVTKMDEQPKNELENIIRDADSSHFADPNYLLLSELLREEWKLTLGKTFSDIEWTTTNRNLLAHQHRYFTDFAQTEWQPQKDLNISLLQEKLAQLTADETKKSAKAKKIDKEEKIERGVETMFKVTLNNHTRLSQIADSKANILLSVNAIIISISLSTLIPKLDSPGNVHLVIPTFILIVFSVVSIIFAILSTKPKVTGGSFTRKEIEERKINLLFFGNFHKMPLEEYQWAMNELMKDKDYLYNSMIKDLYFLGLVLDRKYKLLRSTYTIFMIGIIVSVLAFVYAFYSIR